VPPPPHRPRASPRYQARPHRTLLGECTPRGPGTALSTESAVPGVPRPPSSGTCGPAARVRAGASHRSTGRPLRDLVETSRDVEAGRPPLRQSGEPPHAALPLPRPHSPRRVRSQRAPGAHSPRRVRSQGAREPTLRGECVEEVRWAEACVELWAGSWGACGGLGGWRCPQGGCVCAERLRAPETVVSGALRRAARLHCGVSLSGRGPRGRTQTASPRATPAPAGRRAGTATSRRRGR